jgi:hypothetical protein
MILCRVPATFVQKGSRSNEKSRCRIQNHNGCDPSQGEFIPKQSLKRIIPAIATNRRDC